MGATIALLTDFGTSDIYVGVMKGVMQGLCSSATLIDLTHAISPQNIRQGAWALLNAYRYFPAGTVFLVVVDPGVGSTRRPVAVQAGDYFFVGPDNGVLAYALAGLELQACVTLANPAYQLNAVSQTFHGRDIFAPAAAHLAAGVAIHELGEALPQLTVFELPHLELQPDVIVAEVIHIDHFGNVITSVGSLQWLDGDQLRLQPVFGRAGLAERLVDATHARIQVNGQQVSGIQRNYSTAQPGEMLALVGSSGYLELAINQGNCAARLGSTVGDTVRVVW